MGRLFERRKTPSYRYGVPGRVEDHVRVCAAKLAERRDVVGDEEFLQFCVEQMPRNRGKRDTRRQRLVRTMRRLSEEGALPFVVRGSDFVLESFADVL